MPNEELVRLHFGKHDTNNTGRLSTDELLSLLKDLQVLGDGSDADPEYDAMLRDHFMEENDKDEIGSVTFEQVLAGLKSWDKTSAIAPGKQLKRFENSIFEPFLVAAMSNFLASIWEDVFDHTQEDIEDLVTDDATVWFDVAASAIHLVVVLLLCTPLRFLCSRVPMPRTRALVTTSVQILAGWSCKAFIYYVGRALQAELSSSYSISYCETWLPPTCTLVMLGLALFVTGMAALTAFLPTATPPRKFGLRSLRLHFTALLAGATALPVGYSWHLVCDDIFRTITLRVFTSECDAHVAGCPPNGDHPDPHMSQGIVLARKLSECGAMAPSDDMGVAGGDGGGAVPPPADGAGMAGGAQGPGRALLEYGGRVLSEDYSRFDSAALEWFMHSLFELLYAGLALLVCAWLKKRMNHYVARLKEKQEARGDEQKNVKARLIERMTTIVAKTFDFVLAWAIFDTVAALYSSIGSSYCFPSHGGELGFTKWSTLLVYGFLLLLFALARATNLSNWGMTCCERCLRSPSKLCGRELPAVAWGIILNTVGIQMGWSVHGLYAGLESAFIDDDDVQQLAASVILIVVVTSVAVATFYFTQEASGRCARPPRVAAPHKL